MTLPQGADGVDTANGLFLASAHGTGDQSVADLVGNDLDVVREAFKGKYINNGTSVWSNANVLSPLAGVFGGLAGGIPALVLSLLGKILSSVGDLANIIADTWGQVQQLGGLIVQVVQQLEETPLLAPVDLLGAVWFWVGGLWNTVLQGVSKTNPAYSSLENRVLGLEGTFYGGSTPSRVDDFNNSALAKWAAIGAIPKIQAPNGLVAPADVFQAGEFTSSNPTTTKYRAQCGVVSLGYGRSRMIVQANSTFTNFVILEVNRGTSTTLFNLGTAASIGGDMTVFDFHSVNTGGFKEADVVAVQVDESTHTFKALKNNVVIAVWVDGASTIGTGSTHHHLALCTNIDSNPTLPGCGWEVFSQADVT